MAESPNNLTWEEFVERFKPIQNHLDDNAACDGYLFETYGPEIEYVKSVDPKKIWTMLDAESLTVFASGWHFVNRIGYLICEVPVEDGEYFEVVDDDGIERLQLRLIVDVRYRPNDVEKEELVKLLESAGSASFHDGVVTGETDAEIETYSVSVVQMPSVSDNFDALQSVVLRSYNDGDHAVGTPADVAGCGDYLLKHLLAELSTAQDCESNERAVQRLDKALAQLTSVKNAFLGEMGLQPESFQKPIEVLIGLDGGIVQGATANLPIKVHVFDYDIDGAREEDGVVIVPQGTSGDTAKAFHDIFIAEVDPAFFELPHFKS